MTDGFDARGTDFCNERHAALKTALELAAKNQDLKISHLEKDVEEWKRFKAAHEAKASQASVAVAYVLAVIGILVGVIGLLRQ